MSSSFLGIAVSQKDGSSGDGIHLLWTAPHASGYSVEGFDIQRRLSNRKPNVECYTLSTPELIALHQDFRVETPLALVGARRAACPDFPRQLPDEPHKDSDRIGGAEQLCIDFQKFPDDKGENPFTEKGVTLLARDSKGLPQSHRTVMSAIGFRGLVCSETLEISFPVAVAEVLLEFTVFSGPATVEGFTIEGTSVGTVSTTDKKFIAQTLKLSGKGIRRVVVRGPEMSGLLLYLCFPSSPFNAQTPLIAAQPIDRKVVRNAARSENRLRKAAEEEGEPSVFPLVTSIGHEIGHPQLNFQINTNFVPTGSLPRLSTLEAIPVIPHPINAITSSSHGCLRYDVNLKESHEFVSIVIHVPGGLAIAMRKGKAVDSKLSRDPAGPQSFVFERRSVDQVLIYVSQTASGLVICIDAPLTPEQEEKEWAEVPFIAKGIQLPVRMVNGALGSDADEDNLASSRLLAGETFDNQSFRPVAELLNEASNNTKIVSPVWRTMLTREDVKDPFIELRPWHFALSLLTNAEWRRMLGFGYLDQGKGLTEGDVYDYRITGHFRSRDLKEEVLGFHSIPIGTTLPSTFHIGPIQLNTFVPAVVEIVPPVPDSALTGIGRKGIPLNQSGSGGWGLIITFPSFVAKVVLELEPAAGSKLTYEARTSEYFFFGLSGTVFTATIPALNRVEITFPEPITTLKLKGTGFLYSIRRPTDALTTGTAPDDLIDDSSIIYAVRYESTPAPLPPPFLGTTNLQQPMIPGDPALTTQNPPRSLGFRLQWLPPPIGGSGPVPWPPDLAAFPPFDVLSFDIERRRVDTGDPFVEIDEQKLPTMFFGSRSSRRDPPQLHYGIDLLEAYPEHPIPRPPIAVFMDAEDVLDSAKKRADGPTPPPGSLHQYRIRSIDAIGRRSTVGTLGSVVRLEKRLAPPQPVSPPAMPLPANVPQPSGLRARILQSSDPELTADDKVKLGTHTNAVVFEWGWRDEERTQDPYATEFRVYWQPLPPDIIHGSLVGTATLIGTLFEISANLDQAVSANQMAGRYVRAGSYPFKVASHTAGQAITIRFEKSVANATQVPVASNFEFHPVLKGNELRPSGWAERTEIVPITLNNEYSTVFHDRLTLDAAHPNVRVWVGVSAADNQSYIADELLPAEMNGGRPGNESSIATASASARYIGQPVFIIPLPLPDVPEQVTAEPVGDNVAVAIDLPALLPAVVIPAGNKIKFERLGFDVLTSLIGANTNDTIGVVLPNGTTLSYTLDDPTDQADFLAQIRTGTAGRVESKFLMDFALRFLPELETLWLHAKPEPLPFSTVTDILPNKPERHIQRIRLVDPAGHVSAGSAILPQVVRVPSLSAPVAPEFEMADSANDTLTIEARVHDSYEIKWLAIFSLVSEAATTPDPLTLEKPQLLRLPNRRDLYPDDGLRLRLRNGTLLAPDAVEVSTGVLQPPDRLLSIPRVVGFEKRVAVWLVSLTRDGITSRFSGPRIATTGPTPLVAPALTVSAVTNVDRASWTTPTVPAQVALERSVDGGASWSRVTPWLAANTTSYDVPRFTTGPRQYRLVLRNSSNQTLNGAEVSLT